MSKVVLSTFRNSFFSDALTRSGFFVLEIAQPLSESSMQLVPPSKKAEYVVFELNAENRRSLETLQDKYARARFVIITDGVDRKLKDYLFDRRVVDLFVSPEAADPAEYIKVLSGSTNDFSGRIVLYDDDPGSCYYINMITKGFGYNLIRVNNPEELYEKITLPTVQAALVNIGTEGLYLKDLVARSYTCRHFSSTPVIIYKDMAKGIFVHEIVSGLNRIASCIADYNELFCFLVLNLFKKKMIPAYCSLGEMINADLNSAYACDPLNKIIFSKGSDLFEGESFCSHDSIGDINSVINSMGTAVTLMKGLVWMTGEKKEDIITCGSGGSGQYHLF